MENQNGAMKKGGLKGSFPSGNGGSLNTGLASRESMSSDPEGLGMGTKGKAQRPIGPEKRKVGKFSLA